MTVGLPVLMLGGCSGPLSTLDTAGPSASNVATLWWVMLAGAAALTLLVMTLLGLAFRRRGEGGKSSTSFWLGWLGIAMPGAILVVLLGYALTLGDRLLARPVDGTVVVEATGHQWFWTFSQPGTAGPIETRNVLYIPAGRPIDVRIATADVIHSFWVPRLGGKMDAIPGQVNVLRIEASKPGTFEGQCAEFCGLNHAQNRFRVIALDDAGWLAFQGGAGQ